MDADTITAVSATVIAVASLGVSITQARAIREHNRQSVRPLLSFESTRQVGGEIGIRLRNTGLGPAIVTRTVVAVDGQVLGAWEVHTVRAFRDAFRTIPRFTSLRVGKSFPAGYVSLIYALDDYDLVSDADFWEFVSRRTRIEVQYESLYGGERFEALYHGGYDADVDPRAVRSPVDEVGEPLRPDSRPSSVGLERAFRPGSTDGDAIAA